MNQKIEIFDISYDGAGVGKIGDKVCFVPKTLPGEIVQAKIVSDCGKYCVGACEEVLQEAQARIKAKCPYFEICGGCDFQHCGYDFEQKLKTQILAKELNKTGFFGRIEFVPCEQRFFYRNKIKFEVKDTNLGFFKPKSHDFFAVKTCPICDAKILETLPLVEEFLKSNRFDNLKNVYIRDACGKILICFVFDKNAKVVLKKVQKTAIFDHFVIYFGFGEILESDKTKLVCVSNFLAEKEKKFENDTKQFAKTDHFQDFDIRAFSQVNERIAQKLYAEILQVVDGKKVVNAYSGQGKLTEQIAEKAKFVYGIEFQKSAHEKAEKRCVGKQNVKNICGRVEDKLQKIDEKIDLIVLDPARAGCQKSVLQEIIARKIGIIAYVSCNFATLGRDLKVLREFYEIEKVKIFDMFPCTANLETFVLLKRKD